MIDKFNRNIDYLRISVTDLCNLRCEYCMGKDGVAKKGHHQIITPERIQEIVIEASKLGIRKIRLTGGEPLVRNGIIDICRLISEVREINELCITTNGVLLKEMAKDLKEAGVTRFNISLDTLNPQKYEKITRGGNLVDVLNGIEEVKKLGFQNTKINTVLIGGFNDDEINDFANFANKYDLDIRFIELMPIGESVHFKKTSFISNAIVLEKISNLIPSSHDGVSEVYCFKDAKGSIGLISPLSHKFCSSCNRLRLTSDGKIKPCLHSLNEIDLNDYHGEKLNKALQEAILSKPKEHHLKEEGKSNSKRAMFEIGG